MAKFYSRAKMTSSTTGTGTLTLGAATNNSFFTFAEAGVANGDVVPYVIEDGLDFEYGIGTYTSSGTTLSRDTVRASKIGGTAGTSKINCSGTQIVYIDAANLDLFSKSEPVRRAISGADTIVANDYGHLVEITSGTFTLAFTAAATLGSGFQCVVSNVGTGDVTLDPNGAEQIDGLTSWILYPGGSVLLTCTGSAFETVLLSPMRRQFDSSGANTWTKPGSGSFIRVQAWAGGGSGGKGRAAATSSGGGGGGGGDFAERIIAFAALGTTETATVGAGGASQTVDSTAGNVGANSTFGSHLTAFGGGGGGGGGNGNGGGAAGGGGVSEAGGSGAAGTSADGGAPLTSIYFTFNADSGGSPLDHPTTLQLGLKGSTAGGLAGKGNDNIYGGGGGAGPNSGAQIGGSSIFGGGGGGSGITGATAAGPGGNSYFGGGGGGGGTVSGTAGAAGTSTFGGNGGAGANGANAGGAGTQPGGGGGGSNTGNSGAGGAGRIIVYMW